MKKVRPQTANQARNKADSKINSKINKKVLEQSSNMINQSFQHNISIIKRQGNRSKIDIGQKAQQNVQVQVQVQAQVQNGQQQQMHHETKTEYFRQDKDKQDKTQNKIDKNVMVNLLMKLELQKMGFKEKDYQVVLRQFLKKFNVEQVQIKNIRQWVMQKKSQLVETLIAKQNAKMQAEASKMSKITKKQSTTDNKNVRGALKTNRITPVDDKYENQQPSGMINLVSSTKLKQSHQKVSRPSTPHPAITMLHRQPKLQTQLQLQLQLQSRPEEYSSEQPYQSRVMPPITRIPNPLFNSITYTHNSLPNPMYTIDQRRACPICLVQTYNYMIRKCGHVFCRNCMQGYLLQSMQNGNYLVDCPEYNCDNKVSQTEAEQVLDQTALAKFTKFRNKLLLEINPENKFCSRPDCGNLLVQHKQKQNKLYCQKCQVLFCSLCQEPDHEGEQCGQVLQNQIDQTYKNFKIKKCPNCGAPIQKIDGCNHMTCKKCKNQFCWICLQKYTPYHYRIYNCCGCPGLQFDQDQDLLFKRFLQILFFIFFPLILALVLTTVFAVLPLYMLFDLITKPCRWISDDADLCQISIFESLFECLPDCVMAFMLYILLLPRSILYGVFVSPIDYFSIILNILCNVL